VYWNVVPWETRLRRRCVVARKLTPVTVRCRHVSAWSGLAALVMATVRLQLRIADVVGLAATAVEGVRLHPRNVFPQCTGERAGRR